MSFWRLLQVICWEAGVWLLALNNLCHSFLSSAVLLSATYFPFIRSLSRCIAFLPHVAFPFILSSNISCSNDSCLSTCPNHTCLHFLTVSSIVLLVNVNSRSRSLYAVTRPSVFCLSSVCNVRVPYSGGSNFPQYFYGIRYLGQPLTFTENFMEIVQGEPLLRGS